MNGLLNEPRCLLRSGMQIICCYINHYKFHRFFSFRTKNGIKALVMVIYYTDLNVIFLEKNATEIGQRESSFIFVTDS